MRGIVLLKSGSAVGLVRAVVGGALSQLSSRRKQASNMVCVCEEFPHRCVSVTSPFPVMMLCHFTLVPMFFHFVTMGVCRLCVQLSFFFVSSGHWQWRWKRSCVADV